MYKPLKSLVLSVLSLSAAACSSGSDGRTATANDLLGQAEAAYQSHDYPRALAALDSLDKTFRDCLEQRRTGTRLRVKVLHDLTIDSIEADEKRRPALVSSVDSMSRLFVKVTMPGTDGFYALRSAYSGREANGTHVQPRIDPDGYFFVAVNSEGRIGLNGLGFGDVSAKGLSTYMEGAEMMSLLQEDALLLAETIAAEARPGMTLSLLGSKGTAKIKLTAKDIDAWRATLHYAKLRQLLAQANVRREKYENQLAQLQSQLDSIPDRQPYE